MTKFMVMFAILGATTAAGCKKKDAGGADPGSAAMGSGSGSDPGSGSAPAGSGAAIVTMGGSGSGSGSAGSGSAGSGSAGSGSAAVVVDTSPIEAALTDGKCSPGFTDPGNVGVCAKLPAELKVDASHKASKGEKSVLLSGGPNTYTVITTKPYKADSWPSWIEGLGMGLEGVGGVVKGEGKIGDDGKFVLVEMEPSKERATKSLSHNKTMTVDCWAQGEVEAKTPAINDMIGICKSIRLK